MTRPIPIGVSNFEKLRTGNYYYVDKSLLIADVVRSGAEVILLSRPRRFGKTINLSMLHCFFDNAVDNAELFKGLAVTECSDVWAHRGQYPTVFLTFKDLKFDTYDSCHRTLARQMARLFLHHEQVIEQAEPRGIDRKLVTDIIAGNAHTSDLQDALTLLTMLLHRATNRKVMVLIDEYDTPIHAGHHHGYYDEVVGFMHNLLSGALKDNHHLEKGILTGILRIAKESIFSGLNNMDVHTLLDEPFAEHFGFTTREVDRVLIDAGIPDRGEEIRNWYNGYRFGKETMYNPWSMMKLAANPQMPCRPYWVNTSDNQLTKDLIIEKKAIPTRELETLLRGETVHKVLETSQVLGDLDPDMVWSMLTFSGYLKPQTAEIISGDYHCELAVPNMEVRNFYDKTVRSWVRQQAGPGGLTPLIEALVAQDIDQLEKLFSDLVKGVLSFHDTAGNEPERVYQAFLLGMLVELRGTYRVQSNREAGYGRFDVLLAPDDKRKTGFIFEFKRIQSQTPEETLAEAMKQIKDRDYAAELREAGIGNIRAIAVAVDGKQTHLASEVLTG
ncbi:MAG: AAA family ATPase [Acidobacteriota bacterium]|nr:AAA family ATPase [Acidobacteriota bacterium]